MVVNSVLACGKVYIFIFVTAVFDCKREGCGFNYSSGQNQLGKASRGAIAQSVTPEFGGKWGT